MHAKRLYLVLCLMLFSLCTLQPALAIQTSSSADLSGLDLPAKATVGTHKISISAPSQSPIKPKLTLSTNMSSVKLPKVDAADDLPETDPLIVAARSQPAFSRSGVGAEAVIAAKSNSTDLGYQAKKEEVEKALENENKLLIAFILIFVNAVLITYVVTRKRPLL